jgi:hypothetical protein
LARSHHARPPSPACSRKALARHPVDNSPPPVDPRYRLPRVLLCSSLISFCSFGG